MKNFLNIKFPLTYNSWNQLEEKAILNVINSGQYTYSNKVKKFEREFAKYQGMKWGIMANSGSSANLLAVSSLFYKKKNPLKKGDEVIVPAISWATTYFPLSQNNLRLKIVDVNLSTVNINRSTAFNLDNENGLETIRKQKVEQLNNFYRYYKLETDMLALKNLIYKKNGEVKMDVILSKIDLRLI